jgi:hypothetical protein
MKGRDVEMADIMLHVHMAQVIAMPRVDNAAAGFHPTHLFLLPIAVPDIIAAEGSRSTGLRLETQIEIHIEILGRTSGFCQKGAIISKQLDSP